MLFLERSGTSSTARTHTHAYPRWPCHCQCPPICQSAAGVLEGVGWAGILEFSGTAGEIHLKANSIATVSENAGMRLLALPAHTGASFRMLLSDECHPDTHRSCVPHLRSVHPVFITGDAVAVVVAVAAALDPRMLSQNDLTDVKWQNMQQSMLC